jgi:hypothetical protein
MKFIKINQVINEVNSVVNSEVVILPKTTIGTYNYEYIADINGIAIPMYYQYYCTGRCTISELVEQKIYDFFKIPTGLIPFKIENKVSMDCFITDDDFLHDDIGEKIEEKIGEKIEDKDEGLEEKILKDATRWNAISNGIIIKLQQIVKYDWISREIFMKCVDIMKKRIGTDEGEYEIYKSKIMTKENMSVNIYGYIDYIDYITDIEKKLWEFKCTENMDPIYYLQVVLYCYLCNMNTGYLFNILKDEVYEISITNENMNLFIMELLNNKFNFSK